MEFALDIRLKDQMVVRDILMVKRDVMFVDCLLSGMVHTALAVACVCEQDQNSQKINKDVQYKLKITKSVLIY